MNTYRPLMVKRSCLFNWLVAAACSVKEDRLWRMKVEVDVPPHPPNNDIIAGKQSMVFADRCIMVPGWSPYYVLVVLSCVRKIRNDLRLLEALGFYTKVGPEPLHKCRLPYNV
ncbi:hypothetical protein TNCV_753871 [Trichonephila clavipes]|nr:hypothetical protein TNCV_753871 [Trichonephila clavipes]